jgi:hypothetical protein
VLGLFRRSNEAQRQQAERVKRVARERLGLDDTVALTVSEIQCGDARCPGLETVVLILRPRLATTIVRIPAPLLSVTDAMVENALVPVLTPSPPPPPPRS